MIRTVIGNIVESNETYICHQVNCQNAMGVGVAKALYEKWPSVKSEYHAFCSKHTALVDLLGLGRPEFTLVELVGYEDDKIRSPSSFSSWVVHFVYLARRLL